VDGDEEEEKEEEKRGKYSFVGEPFICGGNGVTHS